jgi:hypothetical protein
MDESYRRNALLLLLTACLLASARVDASELGGGPTFVAGTGWFDCNRRRDQAAEVRLEYRSRPLVPGVRAVVATHATTDGSLFAGTGVAFEVRLGRWDVTPTFVPGLYRQGNGRDLGYPLEFRSQLEIGHRLPRGQRVALAVSHLSNTGLGSHNPGQESVTVSYEWRRTR